MFMVSGLSVISIQYNITFTRVTLLGYNHTRLLLLEQMGYIKYQL